MAHMDCHDHRRFFWHLGALMMSEFSDFGLLESSRRAARFKYKYVIIRYCLVRQFVPGSCQTGFISLIWVHLDSGRIDFDIDVFVFLNRKGDTLRALRLFGEMEERGCSPNDFTYNALLMELCKAGSLDKGMELYEVMTNGGMKLESPTYATFLRTLCRTNKIAEAYQVFDYARESKSLSDEVAYSTLESSLKRRK